jgi:hypothetical protein
MTGQFKTMDYILSAIIALCFVLRLHLIFVYEINWDEFLNLSMVHDFLRGDLKEPLQTIFIHAFRWLPNMSGNEVDQVIAGRVIVYLMGTGTALFIYLVSRRFMGIGAALFAVLSYISYTFVIRQGMSFRTDPMSTFLLMGAIWALVCHSGRMAFAILAGAFIGLAGLVTIKSIFYVPVIGTILLAQIYFSENRARIFMFAAVATVTAIVSFVLLYLLHYNTLGSPSSVLAFLDRTTSKTLGERDFKIAKQTFATGLIYNPVFWIAVAIGLLASIKKIGGEIGANRRDAIITASLALPLLSLFIYTESYVYFYTFLLAPVAVLCGIGFARLSDDIGRKVGFIAVIFLGIGFASQYVQALKRTNDYQREIVDVVHKAFPEPVPYIDRTSMISSYPKKGIFMSSWGMGDYYLKDERIMRGILENDRPPFLIANRRMLELDRLGPDEYGAKHFGFFKEDRDVLQNNYVRHWGPIFVAGKHFKMGNGEQSAEFEILVAGSYQLLSADAAIVDGKTIEPGDTVNLRQGKHQIDTRNAGDYGLRWGHNLYKPSGKAPEKPVFTDF